MASAMILSLTACGSSSDSQGSVSEASDGNSVSTESSADTASTASSEAAAVSTASEGNYKISFIVKLTDEHFLKVMAGANAYTQEHPNVTVDIQSPSSATAYDEQANMIETALSNDSYDAYVISPLQSDSTATLVANTEKPVIACDTDFTSDKKLSFVGTGNKDAARSGGTAAAEAAKAKGKTEVKAIILTGVQGDETHDARKDGYQEGIEAAGGTVTDIQYCDAVADKAAMSMEAMVQKYPDGVDVVACTNDDMCLAAARMAKESGNANYADTIFIGFDGTSTASDAIKDGQINMDVAQMGYDMGYKAVEAAVSALDGKTPEAFIDSGSKIIKEDNIDEYIDYLKEIGAYD